MSITSKLIHRSPSVIKRALYKTLPFEYRYGKKFRKTLKFLLESITWDEERLRAFQLKRL